MKLYYCKDHAGYWPIGVASIILASSEEEAKDLLDEELKSRGLKTYSEEPYTLTKIPQTRSCVTIINDGNY